MEWQRQCIRNGQHIEIGRMDAGSVSEGNREVP